jgi:hypothetical protein
LFCGAWSSFRGRCSKDKKHCIGSIEIASRGYNYFYRYNPKGTHGLLTDGSGIKKQEGYIKRNKENEMYHAGLRHCTTVSRVFVVQFEHAVLDNLMGFRIGRAMRRLQLPRQSVMLDE